MLPRQARASAAAFRALLARPHVRAVAATSLVARLPKGMLPLATVLMLHQSTGSYAIAGSAVALTALGDAASAPAQGRLADRFGRSRVLIPAAAAHVAAVAAMLVLVRDRAPAAAVAACACLAGIGLPPVSGSIKAAWPELAGQDALPAAYALESLLQQLVFLSGPLLVTAATMAAGPAAALICSAVLTAAGTLTFAATAARAVPVPRVMPTPRAVSARGADPRRRGGGAWRLPAVRILACGTMLQGLVFGALPVGIAAVTATAGLPDLAGILLAALTAGGVAGAFGPVTTDGQRRYVRLSAGLAVVLGAAAALSVKPSAGSVLGIAAALAVAGLFVTPIAAASYVLTQQSAPPATRTEAFTWLSTGQAVGSAAGAAVAGLLASTIGAAGALALLPVTVALSAVLVSARLPANQPRAATRAAGRRRGKRS
jgi:MFS family permease